MLSMVCLYVASFPALDELTLSVKQERGKVGLYKDQGNVIEALTYHYLVAEGGRVLIRLPEMGEEHAYEDLVLHGPKGSWVIGLSSNTLLHVPVFVRSDYSFARLETIGLEGYYFSNFDKGVFGRESSILSLREPVTGDLFQVSWDGQRLKLLD